MTWLPSVSGRTIALLDPRVDQVDFAEEAHAMAHLNRYNGHGFTPCSVAHHTLIGLGLCREALRPHWLVHDVHETRLGEIATPALQTLLSLASDRGISEAFEEVVQEFKRRHDAVIHAAAGLPMPSAEIRRELKSIDVLCLATEHRDFHRPSALKWAHEILGIMPGRTSHRFQAPDKVADKLSAAFNRYLPALRSGASALLFEEA